MLMVWSTIQPEQSKSPDRKIHKLLFEMTQTYLNEMTWFDLWLHKETLDYIYKNTYSMHQFFLVNCYKYTDHFRDRLFSTLLVLRFGLTKINKILLASFRRCIEWKKRTLTKGVKMAESPGSLARIGGLCNNMINYGGNKSGRSGPPRLHHQLQSAPRELHSLPLCYTTLILLKISHTIFIVLMLAVGSIRIFLLDTGYPQHINYTLKSL